MDKLQQQISLLSETDRCIMHLYYVEKFTPAEITDVVFLTEQQVVDRLESIRKQLLKDRND